MVVKARVFISCGQRKNADYLTTINSDNVGLMTPELEIAKQISNKLIELGFDEPYIALEKQTLQGVKEAIFERLKNSEYFLFIDFKREGLFKEGEINIESGEYRGSPFSHQELAIATFQGLEVLAFQEEGVKKDDGILKFIQANCKTFSDRKELPSLVTNEVRKKWNPNWRNELRFEREEEDFEDERVAWAEGRWFPIKIINQHKDRFARNCVAYAERIKNLQNSEITNLELAELKWQHTSTLDVSISPKQFRYLDGVHVNSSHPTTVWLGINYNFANWEKLHTHFQIRISGDYEIDYVVFSEGFSPARAKFRLHIGKQMQDIKFQKMPSKTKR